MPQTIQSGGILTCEPSEDWDITWSYAGKLPAGATIATVELFASQMTAPGSTTLAAQGTLGAITLSLAADVGAGAYLYLDEGTALREVVKVFSIAGSSPPYTATIVPALKRTHAANASVRYETGVSALLLGSTAPSPTGETIVSHIFGMIDGHHYRVSCRIATNGGRHLEDHLIMMVRDA